MRSWLRDLWQAALLRTRVFAEWRAAPDAFLRGLVLIVAVALLAGAPSFVQNLVLAARPVSVEPAQAQEGLRTGLQQVRPWLERAGIPPAVVEQILAQSESSADISMQLAERIQALPTRLPQPLARGAMMLGGWLSRPFQGGALPLGAAVLGTWLGYGVWVMLVAKLLGGRGTLVGFFGATALFAVPHVLDVFHLVPVLGAILGFVAFAWGLVVYVKATAVSHEFSSERALLAVVLPALVAAALLLATLGVLVVIIAAGMAR